MSAASIVLVAAQEMPDTLKAQALDEVVVKAQMQRTDRNQQGDLARIAILVP